jgi:uncharacterized protein YkwD
MIRGMRSLFVCALAACGPMYQQQSGPPPPAPGADPWGPPPPASAPAPEPASAPAPARAGGSIAERFVAAHNAARAKHCAGPLAWSPQLAQYAQKWADTLRAKGCMFGHSPGMQYGENLAGGTEGVLDPEGTVAYWYDEIKGYKFPNGGFSMTTGHFTQLVWRATTHVGCGHTTCKGNDIWVCEYDPPGNVEGEYRANVLPTGCR